MGFGLMQENGGSLSNNLRHVNVSVVNHTICNSQYGKEIYHESIHQELGDDESFANAIGSQFG